MPRYMVYCPDYPDVLKRRMEVRPRHVERGTKDQASGVNGECRPPLSAEIEHSQFTAELYSRNLALLLVLRICRKVR